MEAENKAMLDAIVTRYETYCCWNYDSSLHTHTLVALDELPAHSHLGGLDIAADCVAAALASHKSSSTKLWRPLKLSNIV